MGKRYLKNRLKHTLISNEEENMKKNCLFVPKIIAMVVLIAFGLGMTDCATAAGIFYSVNMQYGAEKAVIPANLKAEGKMRGAIIYVAEFIDTRQVDDKKEIGRG